MKFILSAFAFLCLIAGTLSDGPADTDLTYTTEYADCETGELRPYEGDCTKFWECNEGILYMLECPADLYFNPNLKVCDYADESGCEWAVN